MYLVHTGHTPRTAARLIGRVAGRASASARRVRAEAERFRTRAEATAAGTGPRSGKGVGGGDDANPHAARLAEERAQVSRRLEQLRAIQAETSSVLAMLPSRSFLSSSPVAADGAGAFTDAELAAAIASSTSTSSSASSASSSSPPARPALGQGTQSSAGGPSELRSPRTRAGVMSSLARAQGVRDGDGDGQRERGWERGISEGQVASGRDSSAAVGAGVLAHDSAARAGTGAPGHATPGSTVSSAVMGVGRTGMGPRGSGGEGTRAAGFIDAASAANTARRRSLSASLAQVLAAEDAASRRLG